jgi:hypothetical protein
MKNTFGERATCIIFNLFISITIEADRSQLDGLRSESHRLEQLYVSYPNPFHSFID